MMDWDSYFTIRSILKPSETRHTDSLKLYRSEERLFTGHRLVQCGVNTELSYDVLPEFSAVQPTVLWLVQR